MTTPAWAAPVNGMPGNLRASLASAHLNQLLGAHAGQIIYNGAGVSTPVHGNQNFQWYTPALNTDISQPFTMAGTTLGRVALPALPTGNGADLLVTLYPDNGSGSPNTASPIASAKLPAAYQTQVAAPEGLPNAASLPLATGQNNAMFLTGGVSSITWAPPASTVNGISSTSSMLFANNYVISLGGQDSSTGNVVSTVYTFYYPGGTTLDLPVPQPSLPIGSEGAQIVLCNGSLVVMGGGSNAPVKSLTNVFTASWDGNTGTIGAWTNQPSLPIGMQFSGAAAWGSNVYIVAGLTSTGPQVPTANVYTNTVTNGQMGSWVQLNSLPQALDDIGCFAVNGWLVVFGGQDSGFNGKNTTYYAAIQSDGSIGPWQNGPSMTSASFGGSPATFTVNQCGQAALVGDTILAVGPSGYTQTLTITAEGPAPAWIVTDAFNNPNFSPAGAGNYYQGGFSNGDGTFSYLMMNLAPPISVYSTTVTPVPLISVPLYATGLTNGATYHVVVQALQSASATDYTLIGLLGSGQGSAYPSTALTSSRFSGTWTAMTPSGTCVPMQLYDASASGKPIHLWQEPDPLFQVARNASSLLYNARGMLAGALEVTSHPNVALNSNPTFTSGVSPWTATNGTITQSSAQTHGGYAFSGLLTPTGGFTQAYATSELIPVVQTPYGAEQWLVPTGWFYTPTTWSSFDLSVFWFDSGGNFIASSDLNASLTGATWTQISNHVKPPATAAGARILPILNGSPSSSQLLYMSNVQLLQTPETVGALTSAATVNYATGSYFPPTGVTQLN